MNRNHAILAVAVTLVTLAFAQAENAVNDNQSATPSSTKPRLGTPGQHQYMVNRPQARDAVYLVHAVRTLDDSGAGTRFGGAGWSQGGGAAAALAELDPADYGDLKLVGTVCMSPVAAEIAFTAPMGPSAALGDIIEIKDYPRDDRFSLPANCAPDARRWLNDLF
ncbi:MAG: hypothetical protein ACKO6B_00285 [Planctomycetia bacterium]